MKANPTQDTTQEEKKKPQKEPKKEKKEKTEEAKVEAKEAKAPQSTARRDKLRKIEKEIQEGWYANKVFSPQHDASWHELRQKMEEEERRIQEENRKIEAENRAIDDQNEKITAEYTANHPELSKADIARNLKEKLIPIKPKIRFNHVLEEKNKNKYLITFPYPYMNGLLHLGHAFSVTKCEFQARYQRIAGKNVLFPFSFHCTGMPIAAAANRIKTEFSDHPENDKKPGLKQSQILKQMDIFPENVSNEEIKKFGEASHWIEFFPELGKKDLMDFGLSADFTRSFVTTDIQKFYDKFIEWQFLKLRKEGKIKFSKRETIFSIQDNQACADHDRAEGEGVKPQEYTLIKLALLDFPNEQLQKLASSHKIILPAATLRPETMYGQTNLFVNPTAIYGVYEMQNNEIFICSKHSAINMSYQCMTKVERNSTPLFEMKGTDLIGLRVKAPLATYEHVYILPMETIKMDKGTGVVTSVPSDSPDDYACLRDFQRDAELRAKYNIKEEMVIPFKYVKIIDIPGLGDEAAPKLVEEMGVKDHHDSVKLKEAKAIVYKEGFYNGKMIIGPYSGKLVEEAKALVKDDLIKSGEAYKYYEPESLVISRGGDVCIVALVDQWLITYGEKYWRRDCVEHINSPLFKTYSNGVLHNFQVTLNWFEEWGCSRTFGNGTRIPWDKQYLIESLSDSTIYMAFYTIYNFIAEDMYGRKPKAGMDPEYFTPEVFDYIFLGEKNFTSEPKIPIETLELLRDSFTYWYPMDLRCSGKDLIGNHLTMSLYNHQAVFKDQWMPRGFFANGHVKVDGSKMSKSLGNFFTVRQVVDTYGADAARIGLADAGDSMDDANFKKDNANSAVIKLFNFIAWLDQIMLNKEEENVYLKELTSLDIKIEADAIADQIFDNNINYLAEKAKEAYEKMKYMDVVKYTFYEMTNIKDDYYAYYDQNPAKLNKALVVKYLATFFQIFNPIAPHWTEYCYKKYLNPIFAAHNKNLYVENLCYGKYPQYGQVNTLLIRINKYMKAILKKTIDTVEQSKKKKGAAPPTKASFIVCKNYQDWQIKVFKILNNETLFHFNEENKLDEGVKIKEIFVKEMGLDEKNKKELSGILQFASYIVKEVEKYGKESLESELPFDEVETLGKYKSYILHMTKLKEITADLGKDSKEVGSATPGNPNIIIS